MQDKQHFSFVGRTLVLHLEIDWNDIFYWKYIGGKKNYHQDLYLSYSEMRSFANQVFCRKLYDPSPLWENVSSVQKEDENTVTRRKEL